ncbi:MAG: nucleotidyltransferase domain-containing protein [Planctomycetota bacterium]
MSIAKDPRLGVIADAHPHPLLFATISGAHLYGFPSPDSDFDLRGAHVLPLDQVIGLEPGRETIESMRVEQQMELDLVTHDVGKFVRLLSRPNGYVLEQLLSPLVVRTSAAHRELCELGRRSVTRAHARHYLGFATSQRDLWHKHEPRRLKPLLYIYRVLLTGIHLMGSGEIQANLSVLLDDCAGLLACKSLLSDLGLEELVVRKQTGAEKQPYAGAELVQHEAAIEGLRAELEASAAISALPATLPAEVARGLHDFLVRTRLAAGS